MQNLPVRTFEGCADGAPGEGKVIMTPESKPSEGVTPELVPIVTLLGDIAMRLGDPDLIEKAHALAEYEAATKPPVDPLVEAAYEAAIQVSTATSPLEAKRVERRPFVARFADELAERGLTITKADAARVKENGRA